MNALFLFLSILAYNVSRELKICRLLAGPREHRKVHRPLHQHCPMTNPQFLLSLTLLQPTHLLRLLSQCQQKTSNWFFWAEIILFIFSLFLFCSIIQAINEQNNFFSERKKYTSYFLILQRGRCSPDLCQLYLLLPHLRPTRTL